MESQAHGIEIESICMEYIIGMDKHAYNASCLGGYNAKYDIVKGQYGEHKVDHNISIKTAKNTSIGLADISKFTTFDGDYKMHVYVYKQEGDYKVFYKAYVIDITEQTHNLVCGGLKSNAQLTSFVDYVKNIPHGPVAQKANQVVWKDKRKDIYESKEVKANRGILSIDAKIDSKNQRRVQCSAKLNDLLKIKSVRYECYTENIHGMPLPYTLYSPPRQRKSKPK